DPVSGNILATVFAQTAVYGCAQVAGLGGAIFRVNLQTNQQEDITGTYPNPLVVDDPYTGQTYADWLRTPFGILFDLNGKIVFVDEAYSGIYRMDPQTRYLMLCTTCASATWDPNSALRPNHAGIVLSGGNLNLPNLLRGACNCGGSDAIGL